MELGEKRGGETASVMFKGKKCKRKEYGTKGINRGAGNSDRNLETRGNMRIWEGKKKNPSILRPKKSLKGKMQEGK